jgi:uncharacterized protein YraI
MRWILTFIGFIFLMGAWGMQHAPPNPVIAADYSQEDICTEALLSFYTAASEVCLAAPNGYACNGGNTPEASPAGPVANSLAPLGAIIPISQIDQLQTPAFSDDGLGGGLLWMRVQDVNVNILMLGNVEIANRITPDAGFPKWMAFTVETSPQLSACTNHPMNMLIVQSTDLILPSRVVINGVSVDISGTAMIFTQNNQTVFVVLEGLIRVLALREAQTLVAGQETRVNYANSDWTAPITGPMMALPYTPGITLNVPIELFDRPTLLPQPGFVTTDGAVNLRTGPSTNFGLIYQVPAGQNMTILGRNPTGDWYHVRLANGQTGWMLAELLRRNHGAIDVVYESTPLPPQRYGTLGRFATVSSQSATLRSAPHINFPVLFNIDAGATLELLARSPYSPWVRVDSSGLVGWIPLLNVETRAVIESLPIDFSVPPPPVPPEPTAIPGLTGFAFPDPSCFPDC